MTLLKDDKPDPTPKGDKPTTAPGKQVGLAKDWDELVYLFIVISADSHVFISRSDRTPWTVHDLWPGDRKAETSVLERAAQMVEKLAPVELEVYGAREVGRARVRMRQRDCLAVGVAVRCNAPVKKGLVFYGGEKNVWSQWVGFRELVAMKPEWFEHPLFRRWMIYALDLSYVGRLYRNGYLIQ